jgi:hypothetical protein
MQLTPVDVDEEWPFDRVLKNNYQSVPLNLDSSGLSFTDTKISLFETGEWADAEITCKGKTWKVHKCIICTRCKWFERAFKSGFQVIICTNGLDRLETAW